MKVYEIITPQPLNEFALKDLNPFNWGKGDEKTDTAAKAAGRSAATGVAVGGALAGIGTAAMAWESFGKDKSPAGMAARKASKAEWVKHLGNWAAILKMLQAFEILAETKYRLYVLEQRYLKGELNKQQFADYQKAFLGLAQVQFFAPWLVEILGNMAIVRFIAKLIFGVLTLGAGFFTGGVAAVVGIGLQIAVFSALQQFLRSHAFETWMFNNLLTPLILAGTIPYESWSLLRKYVLSEVPILNKYIDSGGNPGMGYADAMAAKKKEVNPKAAEEDEKVTDFGKLNKSNSNANAVVINGTNIVNSDGKLNDYAFMKSSVQNYISLYPDDPEVKKIPSIPRAANSIYK